MESAVSTIASPEAVGFVEPQALGLILVIGLVLTLLYRSEIQRSRILKFFGGAPSPRPKLFLLIGLLGLVLVLAIARPYWGRETIHAPKSFGEDVFVILDVSESMLAKDVSPNRLDQAKLALSESLEKLAEAPQNRVGIILFAGDAYTYCPLTADYGVLKQFVDAISTDMISRPGTNLTAAFKQLKESLPPGTSTLRVVLITDGEDRNFDPRSINTLLAGFRFDVNIFGVGTADGSPIERENGTFVKDRSGNIVISRLNPEALKGLADSLRGKYDTLSLADERLAQVLTASRFGRTLGGQDDYVQYGELSSWFSVVAIILLVFWRASLGQLLVITLLLMPARSFASPYQGFKAYQQGDYQTAKEKFSGQRDPQSLRALGSSEYKLKDFDDAAKHFSEALKASQTDSERFKNAYNLGNTAYRREDYQGAVQNYEQALEINPEDKESQHNLELAKKKLKEQKKQQQQNSQDKDQKQDQKDSEQKQDQSEEQESKEEQQKDQSSKSEQDQKDKEQLGQPQSTVPAPTPSEHEQHGAETSPHKLNEEELKKEEAQQWLDSLPEAPVLLQRPRSDNRRMDEQTW